ncbi:MAG: hypothetical protein ACP5RM_01680 [Candidatus Micrarchaeia archaeon]
MKSIGATSKVISLIEMAKRSNAKIEFNGNRHLGMEPLKRLGDALGTLKQVQ